MDRDPSPKFQDELAAFDEVFEKFTVSPDTLDVNAALGATQTTFTELVFVSVPQAL